MQVLDRTGVGTLWSICKTKFALKDHSHNYLPLSGGTLTGDLLFSNSGTTFRQIRGTCGDNDFWRIGGGATGNNVGYMEIATADDGTEPIYVRQYSGTFGTITRTATLLDDSGNTSFPGTVAAAKFKGALEGNASTASNASTVNGHTVNANVPSNAKFTDTNTWRPVQDNLTSTSTSESLSANQGRVLKGLVDGKANSSHTHSWSQISGAPATATRWPSWGEVTGKPDLKNWSETKSYIDSKVTSSGGVDSLPIGTELLSYNGNNIFGDKFVKEDGSFYKKTDVQLNIGEVHEVTVSLKNFNFNGYDTQSIAYFDGYYYMKKSGYYKWVRSTSLTGAFSDYTPLDGCREYIGNGAFSGSYVDAKTVIIGGKTYNGMAYAYDGKYFLGIIGITVDFNSYINTDISYQDGYKRCKNNNRFLYQWSYDAESQGKLTIADLSTAKVIRSIRINNLFTSAIEYEEVCYDESKNMAVCVVKSSDGYWYVCIVHFSNNSINKIKIVNSNIGNDNHINLIGSTIIWANDSDNFITIYDYYANIYYSYKTPNTEYRYYDPLVVNNNLYASCFYSKSSGGVVNDILIAITYPFDNHDSSNYYQIKNRNNLGDYFVKVK